MSDQLATAGRAVTGGPRHAAPTNSTGRRRGPALAGAVGGVAVVGTLITVLVGMQGTKSPQAPAVADPRPAAAGQQPTAGTGPLSVRPVVPAGRGKLTKLVVTRLVAGTGVPVIAGQTVTVNYVLVGYADGKPIEASWDAGGPVPLVVGAGRLIKGWDRGLPGQRVGSRVRLDVPAALAYGRSRGDLRFVVDILDAR